MNKNTLKYASILLAITLSIYACSKEEETPSNPTSTAAYDDTPFVFDAGSFPPPKLPTDNQLTMEKVKLGRMLFFEPMLSKDGSQTCASCHRQPDAFADTARLSIGVEGLEGKRQAMAVFNMAWNENEFFWDGRAHLLRDQSLKPIEDPLEMNSKMEDVVAKLNASSMYNDQFIRAFDSKEVTSLKMSLAMEQFMLTIVSNQSKYDGFLAGTETLSASEERGRELFFKEYNPFLPDESGADCAHCHTTFNFENDKYMNNGLDAGIDQTDIGREDVTKDPRNRAQFKVTSLRNVEVTPPYMHDGRFTTLEQVVEHYDNGLKDSPSLDPALRNTMDKGLFLSAQDKTDLVAFLKTLTDPTLASNPDYNDPFD